mgnify:CR=1 FL=1
MGVITIKGKDYPVKFGLSVVMRFAIAEGMKTFDEFEQWLKQIDDKEMTFEVMKRITKLFYAGIQRGCVRENQALDLDADDLIDQLVIEPQVFQTLIEMLMLSIVPQGIDNKLPASANKAKKKK